MADIEKYAREIVALIRKDIVEWVATGRPDPEDYM